VFRTEKNVKSTSCDVLYCLLLNSNFVSETRPITQYIGAVSIYPLLSKTSDGSFSMEFDMATLYLRCGAASLHNWNKKKSWTFRPFNVSWLRCLWTLGPRHPIRECYILEEAYTTKLYFNHCAVVCDLSYCTKYG